MQLIKTRPLNTLVHTNMIDLFTFSLCSVSLDGGNPTVLDIGKYTDHYIKSIAVLHEECGKSGIKSKGFHFPKGSLR